MTIFTLLGICPEDYESTHTGMFACPCLFLTAGKYNQPRCSSTDEGIFKNVVIYMTKFYSVEKMNEITTFEGKLMELEIIVLSKISLT